MQALIKTFPCTQLHHNIITQASNFNFCLANIFYHTLEIYNKVVARYNYNNEYQKL